MPHPISRRRLLQSGVAALTAGTLSPAARAASDSTTMESPVYTHPSPVLGTTLSPRGLAAVTSVLHGVGVYVGNDWYDWDDDARRFAMAKIRAWGFDFVAPKVGGYARTWYRDEAHLRRWAESARGIGLGFAPFIYSIPETYAGDAQICAQIARTVGIANVDLEDEWGAKEKGTPPGYHGTEMAEFGRIYRQEAGDLPIIANGYGDPITRFGPAATGFPNAEMAAWADVYSPQWYIGVYSRYHKGGVKPALDWGEDEVRQAMGTDFPLCPSVDLSCSWTPDHLLPLTDTIAMMERLRGYRAPIFVWEYGLMTPAHAEALLGPPAIKNVRIGRVRKDSLGVTWDTHIPARSTLTCRLPDGTEKTSASQSLELTHTEGVASLSPGTACAVTLAATTGGGASPVLPLTVVTAPATPGVFAQSAMAARDPQGHTAVTVFLANSADADVTDVQLATVAADGATLLSPAPLPLAVGPLGKRDWQASLPDRVPVVLVFTGVAPGPQSLSLKLTGMADGQPWSSSLPVTVS